ncbi:MAG: phage tail protein [Lentisphaerota bacterium]
MSNSIITAAGAALIAACQANEEILVIDKMIFADVPGLDTGVTPPGNTPLPPAEQIMLESDIAQAGLVNSSTIVYSVTLSAATGPFYINWIGLYSSAHNTLVAVCYVPRHYKFATDGFRTGNTLYKNFALQVANISDLTGVVISAATWQQDLTAILANYAPAHNHPYEPAGAVATHNSDANAHSGRFVQPGSIICMPTENVPAGYLECDGASLSRTTYAALFAEILATHGAADAEHFNLPDYRGFFLRGWSHGNTANDPDRASRLNRGDGVTGDHVGTVQFDAIRNITGAWAGSVQNDWTNTYTGALYHKTDTSVSVDRGDIGTANNALGFDASLVVPTASENRPLNAYVMYCIKY